MSHHRKPLDMRKLIRDFAQSLQPITEILRISFKFLPTIHDYLTTSFNNFGPLKLKKYHSFIQEINQQVTE
jgi:hypothetical protein